jgi:creatinine amidohydrolase
MIIENATMKDFSAHLRKSRTIIFPFGAVEEHGSHLPVSTDTITVNEVLSQVIKKRNVFLAPTINYGVMLSNRKHPGTLGISAECLRILTEDLIKDAYGKGLKNFLLVSGHGGRLHLAALQEVADTLIDELDGIRIAVFCTDDILADIRKEISETPDDSHSGELETSIMLSIAPKLVKGRSKKEYPRFPDFFVVKDKVDYWKGGVWGDPSKAKKEKGDRAVRHMVKRVIDIIDAIEKKKF